MTNSRKIGLACVAIGVTLLGWRYWDLCGIAFILLVGGYLYYPKKPTDPNNP